MKNIFYDYKIFYSQKYGGPSRYFLSLIDGLSRIKTDFHICSPIYYNFYLKEFQKIYKDSVYGKHIKKQIKYTSKLITAYNYFISSIKLNTIEHSIYHPTYYGKGLINLRKTPTILTVHDLIHEKFKDKNEILTLNKKKYLLKIADHIICVSKNTQIDLIDKYGININKTSVIYPGVKNIFLTDNNDDYKINLNKPFFLYVGTRNFYKNYKNFVSAYSKSKILIDETNILFFGGGYLTNSEKEFFLKNDINLKNIFYEEGNDNKLIYFYKKALALIYPSLYEGFGSVPLEAMNYGCPVISSNSSCLPEVQGDASEKFDPKSIEEIKKKLELIFLNEDKRLELKQKGHKLIKNYSWEKCAQETKDIYEKFM
tara:strand:+ start:1539 stop:2648 length:1110 start_codon:yes stop_codon:yes gene_type:complete